MKVVISVVGKDCEGIIAKVSGKLYNCNVNILDISQTVLNGYFTMIVVADMSKIACSFNELVDEMNKLASENHLSIQTMHEDIFNAMHKI